MSTLLFLLSIVCAVLVAAILSYRVDVRCAEERQRKFEKDLQQMDAENRARREQRWKEEAEERLRLAQDALELSERNRVALRHMLPKPEVAK